jgi:chromosome segregation ATPase
MDEFEIERRLQRLISRYEAASAAVVAARAECVSLAESGASATAALQAARSRLRQIEHRRDTIRRTLESLEDRSPA